MEKITERLVNWASVLEPNTREQAERASELPFVFPHLALMPDACCNAGYAAVLVVMTTRTAA